MSDDLGNKGPRDRERVNVHETWELEYWSKHFGVTKDQLKAAVQTVGPMAKDVKSYFDRIRR